MKADLKLIEKMMQAMGRGQIKRMVIKEEGLEIELERECASDYRPAPHQPSFQQHYIEPKESSPAPKKEEKGGHYVTSPMVGTFYAAPSPEDPAFVKVGDSVEKNTVVCIIEAMKVMNEVKAGVSGKVVEVLVKSGDPVEFGTKLLRIS